LDVGLHQYKKSGTVSGAKIFQFVCVYKGGEP